MRQGIRLISVALVLWLSVWTVHAQGYPLQEGDRIRYEITIGMPKAQVSGILVLVRGGEDAVSASLVNEFGFSLMDFTYNEKKQKVKIHHVMKRLDKWYIKRMMRQDLKAILAMMRAGDGNAYRNRYKINYQFQQFHDTAQ
ncbi:MAG: hypothetical protein HUK03_00785 [Bacteroidaceae bacterium]|nr:hypothetical protein [Bacteroidaceae bacterium]